MLLFRHNAYRKYQDKLISDVITALEDGRTLLAHAPMGLGKTDAVLSPALTKAVDNNLTVFFLTPKISQHKIALDVVRGINDKYGTSIRASDVVGRKYGCIFPTITKLDSDSFYSTCEALRKDELCQYYKKVVGSNREESIEADEIMKKVKITYKSPDHNDIYKFGLENEGCPYEIMVKLARESTLIIADYFHFFIPSIREAFLTKLKKSVENSIVIVDEAHNLPSRIREQLSKTITEGMLKRVDKEAEEEGFGKLNMVSLLKALSREHSDSRECLVNREEFTGLVEKNHSMKEIRELLQKIGESYTKNNNKSSASLKVARFLEHWEEDNIDVIRILKRTAKGISLTKKSMDPSLVTNIINRADSAVLMSGTLTPLHMYEDVLGIKEAVSKQYSSPFSKDNRLIAIVKGVTTRYSQRDSHMYEAYARHIDELFAVTPGGVAVFFPSFEFMEDVRDYVRSYPVLMQKRNSTPSENNATLELFGAQKALLFAVQGGSLAEGVDFSDGEIKTLVIAGLALEEMKLETRALIQYYDKKFGKGWDYAYTYPAITKALQASGRAIRKESDKAAIIFMDERFSWSNYMPLMPKEDYIITKAPAYHVKSFFNDSHF
ncbi:MAG: ATP-dependent DNA helicase [Methanobacteriota archaeon]|nr:MAG: ATP-dependent DNA helicase [Euryarchaeota archaeon]